MSKHYTVTLIAAICRRDIYTKLLNSHLLWARAAADASRGPEQLQMLQLTGGRAGSIFREQLQMLHMGQYNALLYTSSTVQC